MMMRFGKLPDNRETITTVSSERYLPPQLLGSCRTQITGHANIVDDVVKIRSLFAKTDGSFVYERESEVNPKDPVAFRNDAGVERKEQIGE